MAEPLQITPLPQVDVYPDNVVKDVTPQIDVTPTVPMPTPEAAQRTATKTTLGFPHLNLDEETLANEYAAGNEPSVRTQLAAEVDKRKEQAKQAELIRVANKQDRTQDDIDYIRSLTDPTLPKTDPTSVLEQQYSLEYMNHLRDLGNKSPDSVWQQLDQSQSNQATFTSSLLMTKVQMMQHALEEAEKARQNLGTADRLFDTIPQWIPFYWQWKLLGRTPHGLLGDELDKDSQRWFSPSMDEETFMKEFGEEANRRIQNNPGEAVEWITSMLGQSTSDKTLQNIFSIGDLGALYGTAKGALKFGKGYLGVKRLIETQLKEPVSKAAMEEAVGNTGTAAATQFAQETLTGLKGNANPIKQTIDNLPSIINGPSELLKDEPSRFRREWVERLYEKSMEHGKAFLDAINNAIRVERLPALNKVTDAMRTLMKKFESQYPKLENTIMDVDITPHPTLNAHDVNFYVGTNAELISGKRNAENWVKNLGLEKISTLVEKGDNKWAVKVTYPLDETAPFVKDLMLPTTDGGPINALTGFLGRLRTPEETMEHEHILQRKAAVFGPQSFLKVYKNTLKDYNSLKHWSVVPGLPARNEWKELQKVISAAGQDRLRFDKLADLDDFWQKTLGSDHLPSPRQAEAYMSYKQARNMQEQFVKINQMKLKYRLGVQEQNINIVEKYNKNSTQFKKFTFEATPVNYLPKGENSAVMLGRTLNDVNVFMPSKYRGRVREAVENDIKSGKAQVFKIFRPEDQPLAKYHPSLVNEHPHHVITYQEVKPEPIKWEKQTIEAPEWEYRHAIKQAIVDKDPTTKLFLYKGDRTIAVHSIGQATRDMADGLERIRQYMKAGAEDGARAYHGTVKLPQSFDWIANKFKSGEWSLDNPIKAAPSGKMLIDVDNELHTRPEHLDPRGKSLLRDYAQSGFQNEVGWKYDPLNVFSMRNQGTHANPDWSLAPVKYLDPSVSLNRAIKRIINSSFMDDYKIYSINHWIKEATPLFDAGKVTEKQLQASPAFYFHNADTFLKRGGGPEEQAKLQGLMTSRLQIRQLLGYDSYSNRVLYRIGQILTDSIYKAKPVLGEHAISKIIDPIDYARSMAFHWKVGLFSIPQIVVQANTFAVIYGIAGLRPALQGTTAATLYGWAKYNRNPAVWAHMGKVAEGMGWKPGHWEEATRIGEAGFFNVAGETAFRDSPFGNNVITTPFGKFLDWGTMPFRMGDTAPRIAGLYTSYNEFRKTNPTKAITNADRQTILNRADVLTNNMSRASASNIQHGILSPFFQFKNYSMRLAELATGSRLTQMERLRLVTTFAGLYGIGVFGLTGLPAEDWLREFEINHGYKVGEKWASTLINEGLPSYLLGTVTGENYNFSARYGVQSPFQDLIKALHSDKTFLDILSGASGNTVVDSIAGMHGFWMAAKDWIRGEGDFKPKLDDLAAPLEPISAFSHFRQLMQMLATGRQIDKHAGTQVGFEEPISAPAAFGQYLSGLSSQKIADTYIKFNIGREYGAEFKQAEAHAREWIRKGLQSVRDKDYEQYRDYFKRAHNELESVNINPHEYSRVFSEAMKDWEDLVQKGDWDFVYGKNAPANSGRTLMKGNQ